MKALVFAVLLAAVTPIRAASLDAKARTEVLDNLIKGMREHYVLPKKGERIASRLERLRNNPDFTVLDDSEEVARFLSDWLREYADDLHLTVRASDGGMMRRMRPSPGQGEDGGPAPERRGGHGDDEDHDGHLGAGRGSMFESDLLPGNLGYLRVNGLMGDPDALDQELANIAEASALIIDVRGCPGGGYPLNVYLTSILFDQREVLMSRGNRDGDLAPVYVEPRAGMPSFVGKPAFVLTSSATGSACEEISWDLKYHDKAILVGQNTAGAGLGIMEMTELGHGLTAMIPDMRPVHPKTSLGFEGQGVSPDVATSAAAALTIAQQLALLALNKEEDSSELTAERQRLHDALAREMSTQRLLAAANSRTLRAYEGGYGEGRKILVQDGTLLMSVPGFRALTLEPLATDLFAITGTPGQRLRFEREDGQVTRLALSEPGGEVWRDWEERE